MKKALRVFIWAALPLSMFAADQSTTSGSLAGDPSPSARNVAYHDQDIVPLATELRYTTIIVLPKEEKILDVGCGDKDNWVVDKAENYAFVKPAKLGAKTNLNIITESGNLYSFFVSDVSNTSGAHADTKVYVRPAGAGGLTALRRRSGSARRSECSAAAFRQRVPIAVSKECKHLGRINSEETIGFRYRWGRDPVSPSRPFMEVPPAHSRSLRSCAATRRLLESIRHPLAG